MFGKISRSIRYAATVLKHKMYLFVGASRVGGLSWRQILFHDLSKFSLQEFGPYRDKFEPSGVLSNGVQARFEAAWEHHWMNNPHHWEYWVSLDGGSESTPMPEEMVREMIADWIAASLAYNPELPIMERLNILPWFISKFPKMSLHRETRASIIRIMLELGYDYEDLPSDSQGNLRLRYSLLDSQNKRRQKSSW